MKELQRTYALSDVQVELISLFAKTEEPTALLDLPSDKETWRLGSSATSLVEKGLLHREKGRCSKGILCWLYHLDPAVNSLSVT